MKKSLIYLVIALPGAVVLAQSAPSGPAAKSASPTTQPSSNSKTANKLAPAKVIADDFGGGGGGDTSAGSGAPRGGGDDFGGGGPTSGSDFGGGFPSGGDNGSGFGGRRGGRGGFGGFGGFGGQDGGSGNFQPKLETKYAILETRSIFSRDRRVANTAFAGRGSSEASLAFRGAAVEDGKFVAFIEDTNRQITQTVRINDSVGQGKCTAITLDSITYEVNGEPRDIELGYSLAGTPAAEPAPAIGEPGNPGGAPGGNPFGNMSRNRNFLPGGATIPNLTQEQIDQFRQMRDQRRQRGSNGGGGRRSRDSSQ